MISENLILSTFAIHQDRMSGDCVTVAGISVCGAGGAATAIGFASDGDLAVPASAFFPSLAAALRVTQIGDGAFSGKSIKSITIPRNVQILCATCFWVRRILSSKSNYQSVLFETDSELIRIESEAFSNSSLRSITIPRRVQMLCPECFSGCRSLSSISFENESELTRIESGEFSGSSLRSITIPRHVQILCSESFSNCGSLSSISFQTTSQLMRIEAGVLAETCIGVATVPGTISFMAEDAFPRYSMVTVSNPD
jgi:hypothetical protein